MKITDELYRASLSLLTDFYQITMAYAHWKNGTTKKRGVFNLYFRQNPFGGGFTINSGLEYVVDFLENFSFPKGDIAYLGGLKGSDGKGMFEQGFLDFLSEMKFECDVEAIPEGQVVFPNEPLLKITGPIYQCQLLETPLLNIINFQTLVATKAARIVLAAEGDAVLEFGMRRAQGIDGALAASRAAYIGGCIGNSNVLAGKMFSIPVRGTHAHSWVMSFESELEAFERYAMAMPTNSVLLADTFHTINGVKKAIKVGEQLRAKGYDLSGIRLDSGDLAYLSIEARKLLDDAGFTDTKIVASNDLDEYLISSLKKQQNARIDVWGVGTRLATAFDQPALGGVYKIGAIETDSGEWEYKLKLSEQIIKVSHPGIQQVRRFFQDGLMVGDMIYDTLLTPDPARKIIDPLDNTRRKKFDKNASTEELLEPVF